MQPLARFLKQGAVGDFMGERMLEGVLGIRKEARLVEKLGRLQMRKPPMHRILRRLRDGVEQHGTTARRPGRTSVRWRSGTSSATDTRYRLSTEIDLSPRSTSPMNLPLTDERSPSCSWLRPRCFRSSRSRWPRNFRTWGTARSLMQLAHAIKVNRAAWFIEHRDS